MADLARVIEPHLVRVPAHLVHAIRYHSFRRAELVTEVAVMCCTSLTIADKVVSILGYESKAGLWMWDI
jgi:hypothetical protein